MRPIMNLIMAYYHLEDDWKDEKKVAGLLGSMALKRKVRKSNSEISKAESCDQRRNGKAFRNMKVRGLQEVDYPAGCLAG